MKPLHIFFLFIFSIQLLSAAYGQTTVEKSPRQKSHESFSLIGSLYLLEHPLSFYPGGTIVYAKKIGGSETHQIRLSPQLGFVSVPDVETKFIVTTALQYAYRPKAAFVADVYIGINYILSRLAYERYEYVNTELVSKGNTLHQWGPSAGINLGFQFFRKRKYSIGPMLNLGLTRFNKSYTNNFFEGYKTNIGLGITINKQK
jgi:hypothetical protein